MRKLFSLIAAVLFAGSMMAAEVTDVLNNALTGVSGTNYAEWSGKQASSDAVYAGQSAGGNSSIQLRSNNNNSGVITTASGGKLKSITVKFNSNTAAARVLDVYASNTAYTAATDLYGDNAGTKVVSFKMEDGAEQSYTFEDEYTFFGFRSASGALYVEEVDVVWTTDGEAPAVAKPVIEGKEYFIGSTTVTMSCSTENSDIYYTVDGTTDPKCDCAAAPEYKNPITLTETTTIMAAAYTGYDWSAVATKTFTKVEEATCAQAAALAADEITGLNEVVVTYVNGGNIFIKDESGSLLIFANGFDLKAGDVVKGFIGKSSPYKGLPELVPAPGFTKEDINVEAGEAPEPEELTAAPTAADVNKYVVLKGVSFKAAQFDNKNITAVLGEEEFAVYNKFNADAAFDTEKKYDLVGVGSIYNTTLQLYFISATEAEDKPVVEPKDTVGIALSKGLFFFDYTSDPEEGWWDLYGSTEGYEFEFSNIFAQQAEGVYTINDLDPDYTYIVPTETGDTVRYTDGQLVLITVNDTVLIAAELLGTDTVLYRFSLQYTDPVAEDTVVVEIPEAQLDTTYASYGMYIVDGSTEDESIYVRLAIWAEDEFQGEFTKDDLDFEQIGSGIVVGEVAPTLFSADITVTPGNGEGVYLVEADLLTYDNVLYKVTMQIGGDEEGVEETEAAIKAIKAIKNGQIIIEKNGVKYNVLGTRL